MGKARKPRGPDQLNRQAGQLDEVLTTLRREDNAPVNWPALTAEQARAQWPILGFVAARVRRAGGVLGEVGEGRGLGIRPDRGLGIGHLSSQAEWTLRSTGPQVPDGRVSRARARRPR
jgi:hypothetical protein